MSNWSILNQIRAIALGAPNTQAGMKAIATLAKAEPTLARLPIWTQVAKIDFSDDVARIDQWLRVGLAKLSEEPAARIVIISLGDLPEVYQAIGWGCQGGEKGMPALMKALSRATCPDLDRVADWDVKAILVDEYASALPGAIWADFPPFGSSSCITQDAGEILWQAFAALSTIECFRSKGYSFGKLLGSRELVPVLIGFNEGQEFYGSLSARGWEPALPVNTTETQRDF